MIIINSRHDPNIIQIHHHHHQKKMDPSKHLINLPILYLVICTIVITWSSHGGHHHMVHAQELAKRHSTDNERNSIRIPSALCNGESYPLGMESGEIKDNQITASSSFNLQSVGPQNARLNRELSGGAWCPFQQLSATYSGTEWIQVNLEDLYVITAVATQGRFGNGLGVEFAEEYWIEYSRDNGTTWTKWTDMNGDYKLTGNHDTYTPRKNILSHPIVAISLVRIVPFASYQRTTCLRFELYGCKHDHTLPITYSIPDGFKGSPLGDLRDLTYDGRTDYYGYLNGGLGQLVDGIKGDDNYKVNYGYEWVGWRNEGGDLSMVFEFNTLVNFTSAGFYCHNLFSKDIQVFTAAKIWFSYDGNIWSKRPIEFEYMPDMILENPRDVVVHLHNHIAMFVKFDFQFGGQYILISEVAFNTQPVDLANFTMTYDQLDAYDLDSADQLLPFSTAINSDRSLFPQTTFLIVFGVLLTVICSIVIFLLRLHLKRKEKAGHIVVCMKDLATTPLYCEPKDFSSTSSTISNTIADPEYAVPDVAVMSNNHNIGPNHNNNKLSTSILAINGQSVAAGGGGGGGHLNNNLNMFGAGFTRIFMGHAKDHGTNNNISGGKTMSKNMMVPTSAAANITANVVYSSQKPTQAAAAAAYQHDYNNLMRTIHAKTLNNVVGNNNIPQSQQQQQQQLQPRHYYVSADLIPKSPKLPPTTTTSSSSSSSSLANSGGVQHPHPHPHPHHHHQQSIDHQTVNGSKMTSNTIYNKRKYANTIMANDESMTSHSNTLKMKYSSNPMVAAGGGVGSGSGGGEFIEDMKCIPEISDKDIEVIHKQFGCSQFGDIMLGRFRSNSVGSNNDFSIRNNKPTSYQQRQHGSFANDLSPETSADSANGNQTENGAASTINEKLVVLKTLQNDKLKSDFLHEMKSKWFISAKSERVAKLIGFLSTPNYTAMVVECGDCDLAHFLRNCDKKSIGIQSLLHIGSEVASGMKYLESLGYVHRDLSARNCLIYGKNLRVKITDFAAFLTTNQTEYCNGVALRWIAPEALINGAYTTKSDVYSFGVTFWEILTYALIRPHHELDDDSFLQKLFSAFENYINDVSNDCSSNSVYYQATYATGNVINQNNVNNTNEPMTIGEDGQQQQQQQQNKRQGTTRISYRMALPRPTTCPSEIYDLMLECWQLNEQIRPSFRDITQFLLARNNSINNSSTTTTMTTATTTALAPSSNNEQPMSA